MRLIDADELSDRILYLLQSGVPSQDIRRGIKKVYTMLCDTSTIEAEPVKCGKWVYGENEDGQDGIFCSECDHFVPWYYDYYDKADDLINDNPRCPNCGARMDGGKNES